MFGPLIIGLLVAGAFYYGISGAQEQDFYSSQNNLGKVLGPAAAAMGAIFFVFMLPGIIMFGSMIPSNGGSAGPGLLGFVILFFLMLRGVQLVQWLFSRRSSDGEQTAPLELAAPQIEAATADGRISPPPPMRMRHHEEMNHG